MRLIFSRNKVEGVLTYISLMLAVSYFFYLVKRWNFAVENKLTNGFALNPLLWLTLFGCIYLVLGSMLSSQSQIIFGINATDAARTQAGWVSIYTFLSLFIGYIWVPDRALEVIEQNLGAAGSLLVAGGLLAGVLIWFCLLSEGGALLSLKDQRVAAHDYFREIILGKYKLAMLQQIATVAALTFFLKKRSTKVSMSILFIYCAPLVLIDFFQGGRGMITGSMIFLIIVFGMQDRKIPWKLFLLLAFSFNIYTMLMRLEETDFLDKNFILRSISEIYLTQSSLVYLVEQNITTSFFELVRLFFAKMMPFGIGSSYVSQSEQYVDLIRYNLNMGFGLAGNIAAEAFYYGGYVFSVISPWIIFIVIRGLYGGGLLLTLPGLIVVLLINMSAQNIIRTEFYVTFAGIISIILSYLLPITILTWGHRVLAEKIVNINSDENEVIR